MKDKNLNIENKILKLINKLENVLIKDKRFEEDIIFKSKIININENKETETEDKEPIDITALFNLAKLSDGPSTTSTKETVYLNNNIDLSEQINNLNKIYQNINNLSKVINIVISKKP